MRGVARHAQANGAMVDGRAKEPQAMDQATRKKLHDFIWARGQGVIATTGSAGQPEAALMDIAVTPDLQLIFETTDQTRKFANLRARPGVAFVIGWDGNETLQYDGIAEEPEGRALAEARKLYVAAFPEKISHLNWPGNHHFRARPVWIRFSSYYSPRTVEEYRFAAP